MKEGLAVSHAASPPGAGLPMVAATLETLTLPAMLLAPGVLVLGVSSFSTAVSPWISLVKLSLIENDPGGEGDWAFCFCMSHASSAYMGLGGL